MKAKNEAHMSGSFLYLLALGLLCAFGPLCTDIYLPGLPAICEYFKVDPTSSQLSLTSCFLGLAFGQIIVGPISDAIGRKKPMIASIALFVIASALCAFSTNIHMLIAVRFLQGMAGAGGLVMSRSIACDRFQGNDLTRFMSLLMTINSVAPILGPILGSLIITFGTWQDIFIFLAGFGLFLLILSYTKVPESLAEEKREQKILATFGGMLKECANLKFMLLVCGLSLIMGGFFAYLAASPFVFQIIYGFTPLQYSMTFALIAVCISINAFVTGRLARRTGERTMLMIAMGVMIVAGISMLLLAVIEPQSPVLIIIALLFFCAFMGTSQTVGFGIALSSRCGGAGAASGIYGVFNFLFGAACSPLATIMGDQSMLPLGLILALCSISALALCLLALSLKHK